jgi:hypothetical protein
VGRIPQQDSAERAFNKLARTFAAQVETFKRGSPVVRQQYKAGGCADCTVLAAERLKVSAMAITGTVPEPRRLSSIGASSNR